MRPLTIFFSSIIAWGNFITPAFGNDGADYLREIENFDFDVAFYNGTSTVTLSSFADPELGRKFTLQAERKDELWQEISELTKTKKGGEFLAEVWCDKLKEKIPENAEHELASNGRKVYRFKPVAGKNDNGKIYKYLEARVELSESSNQILSFEMKNSAAFSPAMATKINEFSYSVSCFELVPGKTAVESIKTSVSGKAFFKEFHEMLHQNYTNHRPSTLN